MQKQNHSSFYLLILISLLFVLSLNIKPTQPIIANPNTESSPSNLMFSFMLEQSLLSNGYLMVAFSPYNTLITPISCAIFGSNSNSINVTACINLNNAGNAITVSKSALTLINQNIVPTKTVVLQFNADLYPQIQYSIQIMISNPIPSIGSISSSFELYTFTGTGVILEQNWNFGQIFIEYKQNKTLNAKALTPMRNNQPGQNFNNAAFQITIGVNCTTPYSRIKFVISGGFTFTNLSMVTVQNVSGFPIAPQKLYSQIVSPNVIIITFNESFVPGRKFGLTITSYKNPLSISSGFINIYHLPYNSLSPLQILQQNIILQTVAFTPTLQLLTIDGTPTSGPIQFYANTTQYIRLTILTPVNIPSNFAIQLTADVLTIYQGSIYAYTSSVQSQKVEYNLIGNNQVIISGFRLIPANTLITVTMRVFIPYIPLDPDFTILVAIGEPGNIGSSPIMQSSVASPSTVLPSQYISALKGSQGENNKISWMKTSDSSISFIVTPTVSTNTGSSLKIITSSNLFHTVSFLSTTSCLANGSYQSCTISYAPPYISITITSSISANIFPQGVPTQVVINNLSFNFASSHQHAYQLYFSFNTSYSGGSVENTIFVSEVIPQRDQLLYFSTHISNNLNNSAISYPNVIRMVSSNPLQWQNVLQANQKRIISVFCYQSWKNLFPNLKTGDPYPGGSNLAGVTYTYREGANSFLSVDYSLDWDRIDIILDGSQATTPFSIILPTIFKSPTVQYEVMIGVYNVLTRQIRYLNIGSRPTVGNPTYVEPINAPITSLPKITTNIIQVAGYAGSYQNTSINLNVAPVKTPSYTGNSYSAALVVVSEWSWLDFTSTNFTSLTLNSSNPIFGYGQQTPITFYMSYIQKYLTYIPLKTTNPITSQFTINFINVKLPYSQDLPYYNIYLVDSAGAINCYNEFINAGRNQFYPSSFKQLIFLCDSNSIGAINTLCNISFVPNYDIQIYSKFVVNFTGLTVTTNLCYLTFSNLTTILVNCQSNINKTQLLVNISNSQRLPAGLSYTITVHGVSILSDTIKNYIIAQLRDPSGSYIIETGTKILSTSVATLAPLYITEVKFSKNNPIVYSSFVIKFQLPRPMHDDQMFVLLMNNNLASLNTLSAKINIQLFDDEANNTMIPIIWSYDYNSNQIRFEGLNGKLLNRNYTIKMFGMHTPSTMAQNLIGAVYIRKFDLTYTIYNNLQFTTFPVLSAQLNSMIRMIPYFNTQGIQQQMTFIIENKNAPITQNTVWIINFPRFYLQNVWNEDYLTYCTINDTNLSCIADPNTPYQILVSGSPRIFRTGQTYLLKVFGMPCPRTVYLNGNAPYVSESIFVGISENSEAASYSEYSQIFINQPIINPQTKSNYGCIAVTGIASSNMQALQSTFFTINATSTVPIYQNQCLYLTFPQEFDHFIDLPLSVAVTQGPLSMLYTAEVVNRRIGFKLLNMNIAADVTFKLEIASLPNPSIPCTIDMNKLKIIAASQDNLTTAASSMQLHNLVQNITFLQSNLHIVINRYQTITITAGTYSSPILIQPSDFTYFSTNMKISYVSNALGFIQSPTYIYYGDKYETFSVGADQTIIPTTYAFDIVKVESSIAAAYASLSKYPVLVTNIPLLIQIPSELSVPIGGCSVPYKIVLNNAPYQNLNLYFQYDTMLQSLHLFWLNQQITYNQLEYNQSITSRWLSFCANSNITLTNITVNVFIEGMNQRSYVLSNSVINVSIISNATTYINPSYFITIKNVQKIYAQLEVTTNISGQMYYELTINPWDYHMNLMDIKASVKSCKLLLASNEDYMAYIYQQERYQKVGMINISKGINSLSFNDLIPNQVYRLCTYFENQHRVLANQQCINFTTLGSGSITRAIITFNNPIYQNQFNKLLCFFVKASFARIYQVVDINGGSCSLSNSATNYYYNYTGTTISSQLKQTILYFIPNQNLTTDPSVTSFQKIYNNSGITASSLSLALSAFAVNFINSSYLRGTFYPSDAISGSDTFKPAFKSNTPSYDRGTSSITITQIVLDKPGIVYLVLTFSRRITYDPLNGYADIDIRPAITPSGQQILNCQDGYGQTSIQCMRVVFIGGQSKTVTFSNISSNSQFIIYYVVSNQYPLRPILISEVNNFTVLTTYQYLNTKLQWFMISVIIVFILRQ